MNTIELLEKLAEKDWEAADEDEYAIRAALPALLELARAAGPFAYCRRTLCSACGHEYHGSGGCWALGDPPCPCRLDGSRPCGQCDGCVLVRVRDPLFREVSS